jgi:hypothetical protein
MNTIHCIKVPFVIVGLLIYTTVLPRAGTAQLIPPDQAFAVTFHRPRLTNGDVTWQGTTTAVGPPLSSQEIARGFRAADFIAIRITAPVDCVVYGVNNSEWDGAWLVENGEPLQAGVARDFVYKVRNRQGQQGVGHENILFVFRRQLIPPSEVEQFFLQPPTSSGGASAPGPRKIRLGGTPQEQQQAAQALRTQIRTGNVVGGIVKIGCHVASVFVPFLKPICVAIPGGFGFDMLDPVRSGQAQPATAAQNVGVQFSFPVQP